MDFKLLGSILLIVGTTIGAGMLALPIATAQLGFVGSLILLIASWMVMTAGAFLLLEVNLWLPQNSHVISMAKATLGPFGQLVAWLTYLLLLYSLLSAYIAGGSDLLHGLMAGAGIHTPASVSALIFTFLFGLVVYLGIRSVDYVNRGLMFVKLGTYLLLVLILLPFLSADKLAAGTLTQLTNPTAVMVTITSFGFSAIVPSLRIYFAGDVVRLRKAILIGSIVPLFCYIAWDMVTMGIIPHTGLVGILNSGGSTSMLVNELNNSVTTFSVTSLFTKTFTSICVVTSFLGVALSLSDFMADGLSIEKKGSGNLIVCLITLLPPLVIVLFFPHIFIKALQYAGIYCVILLILLPALMAYRGRYDRHIAHGFEVPGGKPLLIILMIISILLLVQSAGIF